jgi:hypothetical protein
VAHALACVFAATGRGDVKALKGALKGRYRLRVGKWRTFFSLDQPVSWWWPKLTTAAKPTDDSNPRGSGRQKSPALANRAA